MQTTYDMCIRLIKLGKLEGLSEKIDVYYMNNRLTTEEYNDLMGRLNQ